MNQVQPSIQHSVIRFSTDAISYQKKYFYNSVHMNKTGAELFTAKLIDTLKQSNMIK